MGKKDHHPRDEQSKRNARVEAVLQLLRKQAPLTVKQVKFCNTACVERFLKAKETVLRRQPSNLGLAFHGDRILALVRKNPENLIADEFSAELAEGVAYVSGHDEESRPVVIFRIKQDYQKFHSQKLFTRLLVFTLEVAIQSMPKNVEQFVLLFDASFFRSASAFMNLLVAGLKTVAEYYPGRLFKAFVIDPPTMFSYLWKGVRPFVELSTATMMVSSLDFEESLDFSHFSNYPRASSLRFDPATIKSTAKVGSCSSSRFSFTVAQHQFDSLKPWYLSLTDTSASKVGPTTPSPMGPALISPLNARSFSFASPAARTPRGTIHGYGNSAAMRKSLFPSTPLPQRCSGSEASRTPHHNQPPRTPRPSFLQSPATFFRRESHASRTEKSRESFAPFLKFYRRPYDEMIYRSKMRPPLGGLISIVSPHIRRRHVSVSQRF